MRGATFSADRRYRYRLWRRWDGARPVVAFVMLNPSTADARFFRRRGVVAYGYGLLSDRIPFREFAKLFHGNNERVDQESLRLTTELWEQTAREFLA